MDPRTDTAAPCPATTATPKLSECWINLLPNELISEILIAVVSPGPGADEDQFQVRVRFPLVAQSVCHRWWHITRATPALWSTLHFDTSRRNDLTRHIQQFGLVPLELHVEYSSDGRSITYLHDNLVLQDHAERIWKLDIKGRTTKEIREMVKSSPSELINLWDLSIRADSSNLESSIPLLLSLPRLRSLHLQHYSLDWTDLPVSAHTEEVRIIESRICSVDVKLFMATLGACPRLRILELNNQLLTGCRKVVLEGLQPIVLEGLEELNLRQFYRHELQKIFRFLRAPQVHTLLVEGLSDDGWSEEEGVIIDSLEPLDLEFPALETLVLERLDVSTEIAKLLPDVKHFAYLYAPDAEDRADIDYEFGTIVAQWATLSKQLPLETLRTRGVYLHSLVRLVEGGRRELFPSLRRIAVSSQDAFLRLGCSKEAFGTQAESRKKLASVVELEIYHNQNADSEPPVFETWELCQAALGGRI